MNIIILILSSLLLISCETMNNKEVMDTKSSTKVENQSISSETESSENTELEGEEYLSSIDNPDVQIKDDILAEKLIEVGDRVFFEYDKTSFKKEGLETLKRQAEFLILNKDIIITIEGHCDERGTREYNLALGERRAFAVKNFLVSLGVAKDRISVISYGKEKPPVVGNNENSWKQSRTAITIINR